MESEIAFKTKAELPDNDACVHLLGLSAIEHVCSLSAIAHTCRLHTSVSRVFFSYNISWKIVS